MRTRPDVEIGWYSGERAQLRALFALAEDSPRRVEASLGQGRVLVATDAGEIVAYAQLVESGVEHQAELQSMAVAERHQRTGIGRALLTRAIAECRAQGVRRLMVATASADIGNLRFYQRAGFRMLCIEPDAFTPADGYRDGLTVDGIPIRDRVWLTLKVPPAL
jgi:GNAT superfamily N-acetyltransferase